MPRKARIDIAGQLYHVLARGNEQKKIFLEPRDYEDFLSRLKNALEKTGNKCLAWCLMPNHFHLLILRGKSPLSELMQRVMTGYVVNFNILHKRAGHLFQNRYKAVLCDAERYFLELVAYIHLNPFRAGLVLNLKGLEEYSWCGHGALTGRMTAGLIEREYVLGHFDDKEKEAVRKYRDFIEEHKNKYKGGEYSGGGLIRSMERMKNILASEGSVECEIGDDRVLGCGDFVEAVLKEAGEKIEVGVSLESVKEEVERKSGVSFREILSHSREHRICSARALYCHLAKEKAGVRGVWLMKELGLSSAGVSRLATRGEKVNKKK